MKTYCYSIIATSLLGGLGFADTGVSYLNKIYQFPIGSDAVVEPMTNLKSADKQLSQEVVTDDGAEFVLGTVQSSPAGLKEYELGRTTVGTYFPAVQLVVRSKDTTSEVPRTRADEPFYLDVTVSELKSGATDPDAAKSITLSRHVHSYGVNGTGIGTNRKDPANEATELPIAESPISVNGTQTLTYQITQIPGNDRLKIRGEERFTANSIADVRKSPEGEVYNVPVQSLDSKYIQIWPVATGKIKGITSETVVKFSAPKLTFELFDLYPKSTTKPRIYKGPAVDNPNPEDVDDLGTSVTYAGDIPPKDDVLTISDYMDYFDSDGTWTMELVTDTPFGTTVLDHVTFQVNRSIQLNGAFTTSE